jgi:hypothetical protein
MASVIEYTTKEQSPIVGFFFCGQKDSMQRIFINKCFLFTVGSVCRVKRSTTAWQTFRWWRRGWNRGAEVAETTAKRLLCCGFRRTSKATGQVYQCSGMGIFGILPPCLPTLLGLHLNINFIGHIYSSVRCLVCGGRRGYTVKLSCNFQRSLRHRLQRLKQFKVHERTRRNVEAHAKEMHCSDE